MSPARGAAENRVGHRVADDVRIGMSQRAALGRHGHAAEDERPPLDQPVQVVADRRRGRAERALPRAASRSSAVVIFTFAGSPATTCTGARPARRASPRRWPSTPPAAGDRGAQHVDAKRLRRLRQEDLVARQRLGNHVGVGRARRADPLDGVADRHARRSLRRAPPPRRSPGRSRSASRTGAPRRERARSSRSLDSALDRARDRVLPPLTAGDDGTGRRRQPGRRHRPRALPAARR